MIDPERKQVMEEVLATIPQEQYVDGYTDPKGKQGFRNPVRPDVAKGLTAVAEKLQLKRGVELGTALGSSAICFAIGGLEQLDTVEFDKEAAKIAQANLDAAGTGFTVHNMDSGEFTAGFEGEIDLIFIDHAKERYLEDFQALEGNLHPRALVLMDNTFNRASECKDAVAYVADGYYAAIFTEPPTGGESTGLLVASKSREVFDTAFATLMDTRQA